MSKRVAWEDHWFHDIPEVLRRTLAYYEEKGKRWERVTAKQIKTFRKWGDWVDTETLVSSIKELGYIYIPYDVEPGPMVMFPEYSLTGVPVKAQTNPRYELRGTAKYVTLGLKEEFLGPVWLGSQDTTLQRISEKKFVVVCEGPYDLLALRCASPATPSLSSLTKKVSDDHVDYLKMLGVKTMYLLYDNEVSEKGLESMEILQKVYGGPDFKVEILPCPVGDPSECLEKRIHFRRLRQSLEHLG